MNIELQQKARSVSPVTIVGLDTKLETALAKVGSVDADSVPGTGSYGITDNSQGFEIYAREDTLIDCIHRGIISSNQEIKKKIESNVTFFKKFVDEIIANDSKGNFEYYIDVCIDGKQIAVIGRKSIEIVPNPEAPVKGIDDPDTIRLIRRIDSADAEWAKTIIKEITQKTQESFSTAA